MWPASHAECKALATPGEAAPGEAPGEAAGVEARLAGPHLHVVAAVVRRALLRLRQHLRQPGPPLIPQEASGAGQHAPRRIGPPLVLQ